MNSNAKVALITGGASGMGAQTARRLVANGIKVAILDLHLDRAQRIAEDIGGLAVHADVCSEESVQQAMEQVQTHYGALHICVNCAGIVSGARIVSKTGAMPLADFNRVIQINLIGTFNVLRLAAAQMIAGQPYNQDGERGVIINTASVAAFEGQIGQAAYSASKGGICSLTLPAARELAKFGIRVMTIAPGVMDTPMMETIPAEIADLLKTSVPFPKRLGNPEEFAQLVEQIIDNKYLNGSVIRLDASLRMT